MPEIKDSGESTEFNTEAVRDMLINELKKAKTRCLIFEGGGCLACKYRGQADCTLESLADHLLANGVIVPVRCKDCIHAVELDKHCDISRTAYRHCGLLRGEETKYVWHKYKKYYKDYSLVSLDGFCDEGELKEREGK